MSQATETVIVPEFGGPEVLTLAATTLAAPGRGQVHLDVSAAGVAYGDVMRRRGMPGLSPRRPFTPGYDVCGSVVAVGEGVDSDWLGCRAAAMMPRIGIGGYARDVLLPADRLVRVPDGVDDHDAVCLGLNYITAYQLLHRMADVSVGDAVLIHGAAGGVGTALLQLAKHAGLRAFGTASAPKHGLVESLGGIPIDYRSEDFVARVAEEAPDGVKAVFDGIGGSHVRRSYQTLSRDGTLVVFGMSGEDGVRGAASTLRSLLRLKLKWDRRKTAFYAISMTKGARPADCRTDWQALLQLQLQGAVAPVVGQVLSLGDAAEAHRLLEAAAVMGKIVLDC